MDVDVIYKQMYETVIKYLGLKPGQFDEFIKTCVTWILGSNPFEGVIFDYCHQPILTAQQTIYFDYNDCGRAIYERDTSFESNYTDTFDVKTTYMIRYFPLQTMDLLEVLEGEEWIEITGSLRRKRNLNFCYLSDGFERGIGNYRITITSGYDTIPKEIEKIVCEKIKVIFEEGNILTNLKGGRLGMSQYSETINGVTFSKVYRDLDSIHEKKMNHFKLPLFN